MNEIINIHRCDHTNVGDWYSTPTLYFQELQNVRRLDLWTTNFMDPKNGLKDKVIIFGGGGLFSNRDFENNVQSIASSGAKLLICWCAGHNQHDGESINYPDYIRTFHLKGVRDHEVSGTEWVPCVSCMHSSFAKTYKIQNKVIVYEHKDHPINISHFPKINNKSNNIKEIIKFLGSSEIIITSTYHGAYWATLLNKKVIVINAFSSKFIGLKHQPTYATEDNYIEMIKETKNYPEALQECREANIRFSNKVFQAIYK